MKNEIEEGKLNPTTDFLPSDGSSCSLVADTRPKIVIDNVTHFMDGPLVSLSSVLDHAATAERIRAEMKS
jgi:hypothetical protein